MQQTLFYIPMEVAGWPLFGWGLLLGLWMAACLASIAWAARQGTISRDPLTYVLMLVGAAVIVKAPEWIAIPVPGADWSGIPIRGYGTMVLLGVVGGNALALWQARRMNVPADFIYSLNMWLFIGGFGGARLFYIFQYWEKFQRETIGQTLMAALDFTNGGLVVYGAIIGGAVALATFCWHHKFSLRAMGDLIAPALLVGYGFGRIGCLLNGCCFGGYCELPWAVTFPEGSPPYVRQEETGLINRHGLIFDNAQESAVISQVRPNSPAAAAGLSAGEKVTSIFGQPVESGRQVLGWLSAVQTPNARITTDTHPQGVSLSFAPRPERSLPVHPAQIYSSLSGFAMALLLWLYFPFRRRDGEVAGLLLTMYPIYRFLIEFIRVDELGQLGTALSISQLVSLPLLGLVAIYWVWLLRQPRGSVLPLPPA